MSGIGGILVFDDAPPKPGTLARLHAAVAHRGPDASGVWTDDSITLVHSMLTTYADFLQQRPMEFATIVRLWSVAVLGRRAQRNGDRSDMDGYEEIDSGVRRRGVATLA